MVSALIILKFLRASIRRCAGIVCALSLTLELISPSFSPDVSKPEVSGTSVGVGGGSPDYVKGKMGVVTF